MKGSTTITSHRLIYGLILLFSIFMVIAFIAINYSKQKEQKTEVELTPAAESTVPVLSEKTTAIKKEVENKIPTATNTPKTSDSLQLANKSKAPVTPQPEITREPEAPLPGDLENYFPFSINTQKNLNPSKPEDLKKLKDVCNELETAALGNPVSSWSDDTLLYLSILQSSILQNQEKGIELREKLLASNKPLALEDWTKQQPWFSSVKPTLDRFFPDKMQESDRFKGMLLLDIGAGYMKMGLSETDNAKKQEYMKKASNAYQQVIDKYPDTVASQYADGAIKSFQ